jgi:hypothetical protein
VVDRENGGNDTSEELLRRFNLIDVESRDVIDFFFLGWSRPQSDAPRVAFNLAEFQSCKESLRRAGVRDFGGYADLFLFDAWLQNERVWLDFPNAIHVDLAEEVSSKRMVNIGGFLEALLQSAEDIRKDAALRASAVIRISDRLGLATAKRSALRFVLDKWGKIIGANSLAALATRRVGPAVDLAQL